ncbi:MAG: branched-chain amino acid ABC transporter permease [Actinomycetota bacterium]
MDTDLFFSQLMNGISSGVIYASIALALVLIYKTTGILNFAQGEMALFSTYITWQFTDWGLAVWLSILVSVVVSFIGGALLERVVIRPVEQSSPLVVVIVTIGMFLAFNSLAQVIWGTQDRVLPRAYEYKVWDIGIGRLESDVVVLVGVLAAECFLLFVLLQKTKIGLALRAVASNPDSSRLVGVSTGTMLMLGWALAAAIGAVAGSLVVATTPPLVAGSLQAVLVFAFAAAALGGFDSPLGAVVGGLIVGVAKALTEVYVDPLDGIETVVPLGLILLVLLLRPAGLFGKVHVERV